MRLNELLESVETLNVTHASNVEIEGLAYDSRKVKPGWLFVAISGHKVCGTEYITEAVSRGAVVVVSEDDFDLGAGVTHLRVPRARRALAEIANAYFGDLSRQMKIVGITGTNGKTTTAYMVRNVLRDADFEPGLLGTIAYEIGSHTIPAERTTPEAPDIHSMFQHMKEVGCKSAVMEVSSHAIVLERVHGIDFEIGIFTNLTQDHLDFHQDMDTYFNVKAQLFESFEKRCGSAVVINIDDPWGFKLARGGTLDSDIVTYGFDERSAVCASGVEMSVEGTCFDLFTPWGEIHVCLKLLGRFNIYNAMAAIATGGLLGIDLSQMVQTLENITAIPGRLELIPCRKHRKVFVDYAHTDDALKNVLTTLREICKGKLVVVFGCGGDRDMGKREKMGRVAAELADYSIITSDNPRTEDPQAIADGIAVAFDDPKKFEVVLDRHDAIKKGIRSVGRKDILLVAGKGHETYQEIMGTIIPFDDRETVREFLK